MGLGGSAWMYVQGEVDNSRDTRVGDGIPLDKTDLINHSMHG